MHLLISAPTEVCVYPHKHTQTHTTRRHAEHGTDGHLDRKEQRWV